MADNLPEERTSEEPLMAKVNMEKEDFEWLWSSELRRSKPKHKGFICWSLIFIPWILLAIVGSWELVKYGKRHASPQFDLAQQIYSPAQEVIEYEVITFDTGFVEDGTTFTRYIEEPSRELDDAWEDLYPSLWQLIDQDQAAQLVNHTIIFPHDPARRYVVELDIFHQLHCLNMIRRSLWPDYYKPVTEAEQNNASKRHLTHCLNQIRQAIMCHGDITPYVWQWNESKQTNHNKITTPHTCRNFEKIREWARPENHGGRAEDGFDFKGREMNDPLDSRTWVNGYTGE